MQRSDIVLEVSGTLDANGSYVSPWLDTGGVHAIRVAATGANGWQIEQSTDTANVLGPVEIGTTDNTEYFLAARYFRVRFDQSGWANNSFAVSVRAVS
ncbi:hypothetical protein ACFVYV_09345 [Streptomyces mirabilis]|uniref:hypothetical protein n=1 Tax=Streptomyces mirabilis TaxID=68239 RepID=UPI0036DC042B